MVAWNQLKHVVAKLEPTTDATLIALAPLLAEQTRDLVYYTQAGEFIARVPWYYAGARLARLRKGGGTADLTINCVTYRVTLVAA